MTFVRITSILLYLFITNINAQINQQLWYVNSDMNSNYFGSLANIYVDTNEIIAPADKIVFGISFKLKNNRLAPLVTCAKSDGSSRQDIYNTDWNQKYFGSLQNYFADTSPIYVPTNYMLKGFRFIQKGNRVAPSIYCTKSGGTNGIWVQNMDNNMFYFPKEPGLSIAYADTNMVITPTAPIAFMIHTKNNRIAPMLLAPISNSPLTTYPYHTGHAILATQVLSNKYYDVTWIHHNVKPWALTATWISCVAADLIIDLYKITGSNSRVADSDGAKDLLNIVKSDVLSLPITSGLSGTDDWEWYIIACLNARSFDSNYLTKALNIYQTKVLPYWDETRCNGGAWWDEKKSYKNAITNELLIYINTELYFATGVNQRLQYLTMAKKVWQWFQASGMIRNSLINDGLNSNCQNNQQTIWSYNQGVILGGLANLYIITNDVNYLNQAWDLASASMSYLSMNNNNIMNGYGNSDNQNSRVFNGIYLHYLAKYAVAEVDSSRRKKIANFIFNNAEHALINSVNKEGVIKAYWGDRSSSVYSSEGEISALALLSASSKVQKYY